MRICLPRTAHPTIWFPRGSPNLACRDNALDLVTIMARIMSPIYFCQKHVIGGSPSNSPEFRSAFSTMRCLLPLLSLQAVSSWKATFSRKWDKKHQLQPLRRLQTYYMITSVWVSETLKKHAHMRVTSSTFIAGNKVNELMAKQDITQVPASSLFACRKRIP